MVNNKAAFLYTVILAIAASVGHAYAAPRTDTHLSAQTVSQSKDLLRGEDKKTGMDDKGQIVVALQRAGGKRSISLIVNVDGAPSAYKSIYRHVYTSSVKIVNGGAAVSRSAHLDTGVTLSASASTSTDGSVVLHLAYEDLRLNHMFTDSDDGFAIRLPLTSKFSYKQSFDIHPGQRVNIDLAGPSSGEARFVALSAEMIGS